MKTFLSAALALASVLLGGCHKDDMQPKGAPVSDEAAAVSLLITIDNLWKTVLKPQLTVTPQNYSDTVLMDGPGGKVTVEGQLPIQPEFVFLINQLVVNYRCNHYVY